MLSLLPFDRGGLSMLDKQQQNQNLGPKNIYSTQCVIHLCQHPRRVKCRRRPLPGFTQISPLAFSLAGEQFSLSLQRLIISRILHSISGMTVVKFWAKSQLDSDQIRTEQVTIVQHGNVCFVMQCSIQLNNSSFCLCILKQ